MNFTSSAYKAYSNIVVVTGKLQDYFRLLSIFKFLFLDSVKFHLQNINLYLF